MLGRHRNLQDVFLNTVAHPVVARSPVSQKEDSQSSRPCQNHGRQLGKAMEQPGDLPPLIVCLWCRLLGSEPHRRTLSRCCLHILGRQSSWAVPQGRHICWIYPRQTVVREPWELDLCCASETDSWTWSGREVYDRLGGETWS